MTSADRPSEYVSIFPFNPDRIRAAAVYCSDGRWGESFDDFLHTALALPRYDRLAIPGGAAVLAGHAAGYRQKDAIVEQIDFLVRVHGLERVVLVAHEGCAYYRDELGIPASRLLAQQREDLDKAAAFIRNLRNSLEIDGWFAARNQNAVRFEPVPIDPHRLGW